MTEPTWNLEDTKLLPPFSFKWEQKIYKLLIFFYFHFSYSNMLDAIDKLIIAGTSSLPSIIKSIIDQTTSSMLMTFHPPCIGTWNLKSGS